MRMFHLQMPSARKILPAAILLGICLFVPAANAQVASPSSPAPDLPGQSLPDQDRSASIPDQKLDAAATALQLVTSLKRDYQQRVQSATNDPDRQRIVEEANGALAKAVTDQGLSLDEFTAIMVIAQNDPQIREKILQRLPQSGGNPPGGNPPGQ